MPRPTVSTPAQQSRDAGLSNLRQFTWWAAAGATGLTVAASLIAANTVPGRPSSQPAAAVPTNDATGSGSNQGAVNPPTQAPQPDLGNGPAVVSGGS